MKRQPWPIRFWSRVAFNGPIPERCPERGPCWIWMGALVDERYGQFWCEGRNKRAHRIAIELIKGPIPAGREFTPACGIYSCCHPGHWDPSRHRPHHAGSRALTASAALRGATP